MTTPPLAPWQRTARTVFQALIGLAVMVPILLTQTGLNPDQIPWLAGVLAVAAFITRIMAIPAVEQFLQQVVPWLAATPTKRRGQGGYAHADYLLGLALALTLGAFLALVLVALTT